MKALILDLSSRLSINPSSLPHAEKETPIIFEVLDADASGGISEREWSSWILDGLSQPPADRASNLEKGGLPAKLDNLLTAVEELAAQYGKKPPDKKLFRDSKHIPDF